MSGLVGWSQNGSDALGGPDGSALTDAEVELLLAGAVPVDRAELAPVAAVLAVLRAPVAAPAMSPALADAVRRDAGRRRAAAALAAVPHLPAPPAAPAAGPGRTGRPAAPDRVVATIGGGVRRRLTAAAAAAAVVALLLVGASRAALPGDLQRVVAAGASVVGWDLPETPASTGPAADLGRVGVRRSLDPTVHEPADGETGPTAADPAETHGQPDGAGRPDDTGRSAERTPPVVAGGSGRDDGAAGTDSTPGRKGGAGQGRPESASSKRPPGTGGPASTVPVTSTTVDRGPAGEESGSKR